MWIVMCHLHSMHDTSSLKLPLWLETEAKSSFSTTVPWRTKRLHVSSNSTCCKNRVKIWHNSWSCEDLSVERSETVISWGKRNPKRAAVLEGSACAWGGRGSFLSQWVHFFSFSMYNLKKLQVDRVRKAQVHLWTRVSARPCDRQETCPQGVWLMSAEDPPGIKQAVIYWRMIKMSVCSVANCITEPHPPIYLYLYIYLFYFTSAAELVETDSIYDDNRHKISHRLGFCSLFKELWASCFLNIWNFRIQCQICELKAPLILCFWSPQISTCGMDFTSAAFGRLMGKKQNQKKNNPGVRQSCRISLSIMKT